MFGKSKNPDEFKTWKEVYLYCSKKANKEQRPIKEVVTSLPDDMFKKFVEIVDDTAYTWEKVWFGEDVRRPKFAAENFCSLINSEKDKRNKRKREEQFNKALESFGKEGGSKIVVQKLSFHHEGITSTRQGISKPDYETQGYLISLEHEGHGFLIGDIDTYKRDGGFINPSTMGVQKSSQDFVKKHFKEVFGVTEVKKPEDEKAAILDILHGKKPDKDFLLYYVYEFMLQECKNKEKEQAQKHIKDNKIKEKIITRLKKSRGKSS